MRSGTRSPRVCRWFRATGRRCDSYRSTLGRPVWVDDPHFNLDYHVRRTALPAPGGDDELRNLVGRVMSQQLDRSKPLWELWVAEGLDSGRWAMVSKTHHCMVDGVSGTDLLSVILVERARDELERRPARWHPDREPNSVSLVTHSLSVRAGSPYEATRTALAAVRGPRRVAKKAVDTGRGLANFRTLLAPGATSSLNGPIGPHRRWDWARARLSDDQADPRAARRHGQRRGAGRDHARLSGAAAVARRVGRRQGDPHDGPGLGARRRGARHLQQQGLGDVRRAARRHRGPGRAPALACTSRCRTSSSRARRWPPSA